VLHSKPLDAAIGQVLASYLLVATMVEELESNTQNTNKTQLLASNYSTFRSLVVCENFNPKTDHVLRSAH
jgi:hypothetical protein